MNKAFVIILLFLSGVTVIKAQSILVEAESFANKGGWVIDPEFVEQMGSPYLLAHGIGKPVQDAQTTISIRTAGAYHIWVRTKNWVPGNWEAPGRFNVLVDGKRMDNTLGVNPKWNWEYAGKIQLTKGEKNLSLHDLTGFEGRCDAIYLTTSDKEIIPNDKEALNDWRMQKLGISSVTGKVLKYDLVVVGGGIAGCAASISAAEHGLKVALVHDRPILGGNASSEIRVHTEGIYGSFERILKMLDTEHYENGSAESLKEDQKRLRNMEKYKNIDIYFNYRAFDAKAENGRITWVDAVQTSGGKPVRFEAPLFVDCTGDGWIGYWAGAEYMYGREPSSKYNETWAIQGNLWSPEKSDNFVMGASVLWGSENAGKPVDFPEVPWAKDVAVNYTETNGEWQWEYSSNDLNQIDDAETIRDHMFRAIYGSFYNYKQKHIGDSLQLKWVSYLDGKRESRRLTGDYIYTFNDERDSTKFEDAVVFEIRNVDVHYQVNLPNRTKPDFISEAMFYKTNQYSIPYRCLYSKNISNLFMAGRDFSCSHVGLGGPRVMRTTGQMGASVGLAASLCIKYKCTPREIYQSHLKEFLDLIQSQK
jgi:hypothetical protein